MAIQSGEIAIYGVLVNDTPNDIIAYAKQIQDSSYPGDIPDKNQAAINQDLYYKIGSGGTGSGPGEGDYYTKSETYNRTEVGNLIEGAKTELGGTIDSKYDDLMSRIVKLHSELKTTVSPTYFEKGVSTEITFSSSVQFDGQVLSSTMTVDGESETQTTISDSKTFEIVVNVDSADPKAKFTKTARVTVNAYAPIFVGFTGNDSLTSAADLSKYVQAGLPLNYTESSVQPDNYLWVCVAQSVMGTGNISVKSGGFEVPMTSSATFNSSDPLFKAGAYKVWRSVNKFNGGSAVTVQISKV